MLVVTAVFCDLGMQQKQDVQMFVCSTQAAVCSTLAAECLICASQAGESTT
jgi:hypothetical protein